MVKSITGQVSSSILECRRKTIGSHKTEIDLLLEVAATTEYFVIELDDVTTVKSNFVKRKMLSGSKLRKGTERCLDLANREFTLLLVFFDLWRKFGNAIRDLIIGNYSNVFKSLRWIIESLVFWADFQCDNRTGFEAFIDYYDMKPRPRKRDHAYMRRAIYDTNILRIDERLLLKEKYRHPFKETLNDLEILKGTYNKKNKSIRPPELRDQLRRLYHEFSGLSHVSNASLTEIDINFRKNFAFLMGFEYDKEKFHVQIDKIWHTIDLVICIIILSGTRFYEYESGYELLEFMKVQYKYAAKKLISLAYSKALSKKMPNFISLTRHP